MIERHFEQRHPVCASGPLSDGSELIAEAPAAAIGCLLLDVAIRLAECRLKRDISPGARARGWYE